MRWWILLLLFLARIGQGFQFQTLGSVGDNLVQDFGLGYAEIGTLIGLFMLPGLFLALPAGYSGRFFSDRLLAGLGLGALALGGLVSGYATDSWMIGVGRILSGAGFLFSTLYFTKMTAEWFAGKEIATAMSILVMSWPFGIAMGQVGHEWLAETIHWRWPFFVASAYCAVGSLAVLALYRPPGTASSSGNAPPTMGLNRQEWYLILFAGLAWGIFNVGYVIYLTFAPLVLEAQGQTAITAAAIISVGSWIMIFSGAACGQIVDRTGKPNIVLTVCMFAAIAAMLLLAVEGRGLAASLLIGLIGIAPAGVIMALSGEAMRPDRRAFGMGVFFTIYYAVMAAGPPLAGWIYDSTGEPFAPILFGVLMFAAVIPANFLFRAVQKRKPAAAVSA